MPKLMTGSVQKKAMQAKNAAAAQAPAPRLDDIRRSRKEAARKSRMSQSMSQSNGAKQMRTSHLTGKSSTNIEAEVEEERLPIYDPRFLAFIYIAILINALQMGLQVDISGGTWDTIWKCLDHVFTVIFAGEMVIKIYYLRWTYFFDKWNVLDFFIAWSSILDSWVIPLATGGGGGAVLRMFQFLRLLRMVKVLRMRRDLMALVEGIIASMRSMFWVSLLLLLAIYTAAILCVAIVGEDDLNDEYKEAGYDNVFAFGTLRRAMLTLFSISILDNWSSIITPISEVQPYMLPFFLLFLVTTSFGLMNALIGIIVEQTTAATARIEAMDEEQRRQEQLDRVTELIEVVSKIDESSDGQISIEEMENAKHDEDLNRILRSIDLPPGFTVTDLHLMLDENGNGTMSQDDFVEGMYQLIFCNEFQNQCVAKLSVSQIKKCVFELRNDMFQEMKFMRQQILSLQRHILGEDVVLDLLGADADAGSSADQAGGSFFTDRPDIKPITKIAVSGSYSHEESKLGSAGSTGKQKGFRRKDDAKAESSPAAERPSLDDVSSPAGDVEATSPVRAPRKKRNSNGKPKKKGGGVYGDVGVPATVEGVPPSRLGSAEQATDEKDADDQSNRLLPE